MSKKESDNKVALVEAPVEEARQLLFKDALVGFDDVIDAHYAEMTYVGYRLAHNPISEVDNLPPMYQQYESLTNAKIQLPERPEDDADDKTQYDYVADNALSFNDSDWNLASYWLGQVEKRKTDTAKENLKRKRGDSIVKVYIDMQCGLMEKEADEIGHRNFLQYEDFRLEEHIDADYGYKPLESFLKDMEQ